MLGFFPVVGTGTPPTPHPQASVPAPLPPGSRAGAHSLAREGLVESQFRRGDIHCDTLYTCFVSDTFPVMCAVKEGETLPLMCTVKEGEILPLMCAVKEGEALPLMCAVQEDETLP